MAELGTEPSTPDFSPISYSMDHAVQKNIPSYRRLRIIQVNVKFYLFIFCLKQCNICSNAFWIQNIQLCTKCIRGLRQHGNQAEAL